MKKQVTGFLGFINKLEDWFLILTLAVMVVLAVAQIFFRNVFGEGVVWIDPLLRVLVLWVAIGGAVVATRNDNHIRIDFFTRYVSKKHIKYLQRSVYAFCIFVCSLISWHAVRFVQMDYEYETIAFANIPAWVTELIIPIGFFMIAFRYLLLFISPPEQDAR
ncbi:MAG: TRAP transporter small permease [Gammaproteobacteria bacterium]|nr:TRAP transporter small permease [Gammaproteobacteria bacterium]